MFDRFFLSGDVIDYKRHPCRYAMHQSLEGEPMKQRNRTTFRPNRKLLSCAEREPDASASLDDEGTFRATVDERRPHAQGQAAPTVMPRAISPAPVPHFEMTFTAVVNGTSTRCTRSRATTSSVPAAGVGTEGMSTV